VKSDKSYGNFSGRTPEDLLAGARVDVAPYKRDPGDFVLWKPSSDDLPGWDSPWGRGRPGWHIECSAMSWKHLGENFDIHGGGDDLIFPHHENEIAQSCCAFPNSTFANIWVHNRMLLVNGEKMSKSLGNFLTIRDALTTTKAEVIRFLLIRSQYRSTLDYSVAALDDANREMDRFYRALEKFPSAAASDEIPARVIEPLSDDLNTPGAIAGLRHLADAVFHGDEHAASDLLAGGRLLGLFNQSPDDWFRGSADDSGIEHLIRDRKSARANKNFARADAIRAELEALDIELQDGPGGTTWRRIKK
jgi:cysteinyl-tRNA synthetase